MATIQASFANAAEFFNTLLEAIAVFLILDFRSGSWLTAAHDAINGTSLQPLETNDGDCRRLSKHPIDAAVTRNLCLLDRLAFAPVVPFIEQGIKCGSTSAFAVLAAGGFIIGAQWLVSDLAAEFCGNMLGCGSKTLPSRRRASAPLRSAGACVPVSQILGEVVRHNGAVQIFSQPQLTPPFFDPRLRILLADSF
jgi:hypothetical protein